MSDGLNELDELKKKSKDLENQKNDCVCPHCGRCLHCGRRPCELDCQPYPYWPWPYWDRPRPYYVDDSYFVITHY